MKMERFFCVMLGNAKYFAFHSLNRNVGFAEATFVRQ